MSKENNEIGRIESRAALFLLSDLGMGGSERKVIRLANAMHRSGHVIHVVYLNEPHLQRPNLDAGIMVQCLDRHGKFSLGSVYRLAQYILRNKICHVVCVNLYPILYGWLASRFFPLNPPRISALLNTTEFLSKKESQQMNIYAPILRRLDDLIFGCNLQMGKWIDRYNLPVRRSSVIYNGVDTGIFNLQFNAGDKNELRRQYGIPLDAVVFIMVGQFRPEKKQSDLIDAVANLVAKGISAHALLVGDGRTKDALTSHILTRCMLEHVHMIGEVNDVRPFLKLADVFVLTSVAVETFSNAALEAMSMGLPIVISRIGGASEMIDERCNGVTYEAGNVQELTTHLCDLAKNQEKCSAMGHYAIKLVSDKFSFDRMVMAYERLMFGEPRG